MYHRGPLNISHLSKIRIQQYLCGWIKISLSLYHLDIDLGTLIILEFFNLAISLFQGLIVKFFKKIFIQWDQSIQCIIKVMKCPQRNSAAKAIEEVWGVKVEREEIHGAMIERERERGEMQYNTTAIGCSRDKSKTTKVPLQFRNNYHNDIPCICLLLSLPVCPKRFNPANIFSMDDKISITDI